MAAIACRTAPPEPAPTTTTTTTTPAAPPTTLPLRLMITADEHGWMLPLKDAAAKVQKGGVLRFAERVAAEGFAPDQTAHGSLLLSAGDMWTGPYESTVLEGAPMVALMSKLGYAAAAVGNHEFDFGVRVLGERKKASSFPFLAANLVEVQGGAVPAWAKPFVLIDVDGHKIGVLGFTNVDSPITADPRHMTGLRFRDYGETLVEWVPKVRAAGAEHVILLVHDDVPVLLPLAPKLRELGVHLVAAGHRHVPSLVIDDNATEAVDDDVVFCNPGAYLRSYCRIDADVQLGPRGGLRARSARIEKVQVPLDAPAPTAFPELAAIVAQAEESANQIGGEVLVESTRPLKRGPDGALGQLVVDAWLEALPYAQIAITNVGGIRQDLDAGPVRVKDVVSVLPFNNYLLVVDMTGAQLREVLAGPEPIVAGVRYTWRPPKDAPKDGVAPRTVTSLVDRNGAPIGDEQRLKVIINDFMYRGGDRFRFQSYDPEPEETAIDWREPVLRMLRDMGKQRRSLERDPDDRARRE